MSRPMTQVEEEARAILEHPRFGDPESIRARNILAAIAEIEEAILDCPHYSQWEWSCEPCCARMSYLAAMYPVLFNDAMNRYHHTAGQWA